MAAVRAYGPLLTDAPVERLHALRIEFKKLRYTVEYFREVLGKQYQEIIGELKIIQDHLGDLNDAQVATVILGEFIAQWEPLQNGLPIQERRNIEAIVNYLASRHAERHRLMAGFEKVWRHFNRSGFRKSLAAAVSAL
jgi:CHAD domain-containing protein